MTFSSTRKRGPLPNPDLTTTKPPPLQPCKPSLNAASHTRHSWRDSPDKLRHEFKGKQGQKTGGHFYWLVRQVCSPRAAFCVSAIAPKCHHCRGITQHHSMLSLNTNSVHCASDSNNGMSRERLWQVRRMAEPQTPDWYSLLANTSAHSTACVAPYKAAILAAVPALGETVEYDLFRKVAPPPPHMCVHTSSAHPACPGTLLCLILFTPCAVGSQRIVKKAYGHATRLRAKGVSYHIMSILTSIPTSTPPKPSHPTHMPSALRTPLRARSAPLHLRTACRRRVPPAPTHRTIARRAGRSI